MGELNGIANILIVLIRMGVIFRIVYLSIATIINSEDAEINKKKAYNVLVAYIFAETIFGIKNALLQYYS